MAQSGLSAGPASLPRRKLQNPETRAFPHPEDYGRY
jgi:hypothetical protein